MQTRLVIFVTKQSLTVSHSSLSSRRNKRTEATPTVFISVQTGQNLYESVSEMFPYFTCETCSRPFWIPR